MKNKALEHSISCSGLLDSPVAIFEVVVSTYYTTRLQLSQLPVDRQHHNRVASNVVESLNDAKPNLPLLSFCVEEWNGDFADTQYRQTTK